MKRNNISVAVIGGGASGLAAAIFAARAALVRKVNADISIYDSNPRVGKKILVTGNGRCNFTNENVGPHNFHGDADFAFGIYSRFNSEQTRQFFRSIGVFSKSDNAGRVYPTSPAPSIFVNNSSNCPSVISSCLCFSTASTTLVSS